MDMRFYWVVYRIKQKYLDFFWKPDRSNLGVYFSKHYLSEHHKGMKPIYLHCTNIGQAYEKLC